MVTSAISRSVPLFRLMLVSDQVAYPARTDIEPQRFYHEPLCCLQSGFLEHLAAHVRSETPLFSERRLTARGKHTNLHGASHPLRAEYTRQLFTLLSVYQDCTR